VDEQLTGRRSRLDMELVRRGLVRTRQQAQEAVASGKVLVAGVVADKSGRMVAPGDALLLTSPGPRFVSRGGDKLDAALECFALDVSGLTVLDLGSSTGGFVDSLLQRRALRVFAVDVGRGQLAQRLRNDERVIVRERTNARTLTAQDISEPGEPFEPADMLTADLSFISLTVVAPRIACELIKTGGHLVLLVKPQFEAGRAEVSRGKGVVRDPGVWRSTMLRVGSALEASGSAVIEATASPVIGPAGNVEFFLHAIAGVDPLGAANMEHAVDSALRDVDGIAGNWRP